MSFVVNNRIQTSSIWLGDWSLSSIYFKNDVNFPWAILVPRENNIQEIYQLSGSSQQQLINEISLLSQIIDDYFKPDKLNIGTLGNIVSQLHIHIVARFKEDKAWPHGVWQAAVTPVPYSQNALNEHVQNLSKRIIDSRT